MTEAMRAAEKLSRGSLGDLIGYENRERIREFLAANPGATNVAISNALGLSAIAVGRHVQKLRESTKTSTIRSSTGAVLNRYSNTTHIKKLSIPADLAVKVKEVSTEFSVSAAEALRLMAGWGYEYYRNVKGVK